MPQPDPVSLFPRLSELAKVLPFSRRWAFAQLQRPHIERCISQLKVADSLHQELGEVVKFGNALGRHWFRQQAYVLFKVDSGAYKSLADVQAFEMAATESVGLLRDVDEYETGYWFDDQMKGLSFAYSSTPPDEAGMRAAKRAMHYLNNLKLNDPDDWRNPPTVPLIGTFQREVAGYLMYALTNLKPNLLPPPVPLTFVEFLAGVRRWIIECGRQTTGESLPQPVVQKPPPQSFKQTPPSKNRQDDILSVIRKMATPLHRDEIRKELKLKSPGALGRHLSWMVKQNILRNYDGFGYWPTSDGKPPGT